jgi:hypothetical protein
VRTFRSDSLTSCRIHDCIMNDGVNWAREIHSSFARSCSMRYRVMTEIV